VTTLAVHLVGGQARGRINRQTEFAIPCTKSLASGRIRTAFAAAYRRFADTCRAVDEPGLAVIAVDERTAQPCGIVRIHARIGRHVVATVGRHDRCDLFLDGHDELALRQFVVVVDPVSSFARDARVTYRVLDLRTSNGFSDEHGNPLRAVQVDGTAILRCAGYVLFALPLGDSTDWPPGADDAWSILPERVYAGETTREEARSMRRRSLMISRLGPRETGMLLVDGRAAGTLEVIGPNRRGVVEVGDAALRDGLLLGRYVRCDSARILDDGLLSRVHVLLLQAGDTLLAIDTASTHGIARVDGSPERVIALPDRAELRLATSTRLRWCRAAATAI